MIHSLTFAGRSVSDFQLGVGVGALTVFAAMMLLGFMAVGLLRNMPSNGSKTG